MEAWRKTAYELLPTFQARVDEAEDVGMLWVELWVCCEVEGISDEALSEEAISGLFRYASWCLLSGDEKCENAAIVHFYEMLPTIAHIRTNLHRYLSVEDFLGLKELFEYMLSKEEHVEFVEEFLEKASQAKGSRSPIKGDA